MEYISKMIGSAALDGIFEIPPMLRNRTVQVIVLPVNSEVAEEPKRKINFDFLKDKVPPLPDSFFDPLPEEELQAWGL
ncbi:MAG: hypothetical protein FWD48_03915 [Oscillospiraceae bacterium]|nr:hypothetical protein [Oscillospiraceae bacterium]